MSNANNSANTVDNLISKVEKLVTLYTSSLDKIEQQKFRINELEKELNDLKSGNKELNNKLKSTKLANAIVQGVGNTEAQNKINILVREIDKCIALLNK